MTKAQAIAQLKAAGAEKVTFDANDEFLHITAGVNGKTWTVGARAEQADFATMVDTLKLLMPKQIEAA
jgi:hypothetical protein